MKTAILCVVAVVGAFIIFLPEPMTREEMIEKGYMQYLHNEPSTILRRNPRGKTRWDDYTYCVEQRYYKVSRKEEFCRWFAGIGQYTALYDN